MRLKLHELGIFARFTRKMQAHHKTRLAMTGILRMLGKMHGGVGDG
jgi:hypothetical protein